mmetsp:Transcript_59020/g.127681  ORF Transcript_59020/g.127681 Transcript_59020/m.127681 type:complete len:91 (+) Transcript_59020:326-598(+)
MLSSNMEEKCSLGLKRSRRPWVCGPRRHRAPAARGMTVLVKQAASHHLFQGCKPGAGETEELKHLLSLEGHIGDRHLEDTCDKLVLVKLP